MNRFRNLERFRTGGTDDEMRLSLPLERVIYRIARKHAGEKPQG